MNKPMADLGMYRSGLVDMLVTHANMKGLGLTPLFGDRRCFMPPQLKTNKQNKVSTFATGQRKGCLLFITGTFTGHFSLFSEIGRETNHVKVFVDVVHDLGFQESLGSIVHDFVAKFGFGNVLSQLFDSSAWNDLCIVFFLR